MTCARQRVGRGHTGQSAADDDAVVLVANAVEKILGHGLYVHRLEAMPVGHHDARNHGADDAHPALVGAADEQVLEVRRAVGSLERRAVNGAVVVTGEVPDRSGGEGVGGDDVRAKVGNEADGRCVDRLACRGLFSSVDIRRQRAPAIVVGQRRSCGSQVRGGYHRRRRRN